MARVTIEDCSKHVENQFDLVLLAAERAKKLSLGAEPTITRKDDKNTVLALREFATGEYDIEGVEDNIIKSMQRCVPAEPVQENEEWDEQMKLLSEGLGSLDAEENDDSNELEVAGSEDLEDTEKLFADMGYSTEGSLEISDTDDKNDPPVSEDEDLDENPTE